jgi:L-alanine-DL-glutamate epimerase-like enolase superfamily enzyme
MLTLTHTHITSHALRTRMPFRYGIVTLTELPHVFVNVTLEIDGVSSHGLSADHLPPKWFTKDPDRDPRDEITDMRRVIDQAAAFAKDIKAPTLFTWWWDLFQKQDRWSSENHIPPLLAHFGTSLLERAAIDAFCRAKQQPFHQLLHQNAFGIDWSLNEPRLAGVDWISLLPAQPLSTATIRHTVGMVDKLRESDISPKERLDDGLPQSLEACISRYGLGEFKLKLSGDTESDLKRLSDIAAVITEHAPADFRFSLDANEQFTSPDQLHAFAIQSQKRSHLRTFLGRLAFVEQPLSRKVALSPDQPDIRACWPEPVSLIIDESDGGWEDLPTALDKGYSGVSHKNCKGVFKGIRNACLVRKHQQEQPDDRPWLTSAEDLANIGPIALQQDLAVQAALGNVSIERNGHHYFDGLLAFPESIQQAVLHAHPDLYRAPCHLHITDGQISLDSINNAPFGTPVFPMP